MGPHSDLCAAGFLWCKRGKILPHFPQSEEKPHGTTALCLIQACGFLPGRCHFSTFKQCQEWLSRLSRATARPAKPEDLFAFAYHAWCLGLTEEDQHTHLCQPANHRGGSVAGEHIRCRQEAELVRMGFDLQNVWRVSHINSNYK
ncbi:Myotubularin- protein 4 [Saguinus oedipus]|uniref:Myotubularin- protein 4 n=1 Tax=Saguinus oedipus TaxID=9490 RepID=A0ABQ9VPJ5_SAGOE|nr:Myotubularin- protein 4 [Saguinus oedipus]